MAKDYSKINELESPNYDVRSGRSSHTIGKSRPYSTTVGRGKPFSTTLGRGKPFSQQISRSQGFSKPVGRATPFSKPISQKRSFSKPVTQKQSFSKPISQKRPFSSQLSKKQAFSKPVSQKQSFSKPIAQKQSFSKPVAQSQAFSKPISSKRQGSFSLIRSQAKMLDVFNTAQIGWSNVTSKQGVKIDEALDADASLVSGAVSPGTVFGLSRDMGYGVPGYEEVVLNEVSTRSTEYVLRYINIQSVPIRSDGTTPVARSLSATEAPYIKRPKTIDVYIPFDNVANSYMIPFVPILAKMKFAVNVSTGERRPWINFNIPIGSYNGQVSTPANDSDDMGFYDLNSSKISRIIFNEVVTVDDSYTDNTGATRPNDRFSIEGNSNSSDLFITDSESDGFGDNCLCPISGEGSYIIRKTEYPYKEISSSYDGGALMCIRYSVTFIDELFDGRAIKPGDVNSEVSSAGVATMLLKPIKYAYQESTNDYDMFPESNMQSVSVVQDDKVAFSNSEKVSDDDNVDDYSYTFTPSGYDQRKIGIITGSVSSSNTFVFYIDEPTHNLAHRQYDFNLLNRDLRITSISSIKFKKVEVIDILPEKEMYKVTVTVNGSKDLTVMLEYKKIDQWELGNKVDDFDPNTKILTAKYLEYPEDLFVNFGTSYTINDTALGIANFAGSCSECSHALYEKTIEPQVMNSIAQAVTKPVLIEEDFVLGNGFIASVPDVSMGEKPFAIWKDEYEFCMLGSSLPLIFPHKNPYSLNMQALRDIGVPVGSSDLEAIHNYASPITGSMNFLFTPSITNGNVYASMPTKTKEYLGGNLKSNHYGNKIQKVVNDFGAKFIQYNNRFYQAANNYERLYLGSKRVVPEVGEFFCIKGFILASGETDTNLYKITVNETSGELITEKTATIAGKVLEEPISKSNGILLPVRKSGRNFLYTILPDGKSMYVKEIANREVVKKLTIEGVGDIYIAFNYNDSSNTDIYIYSVTNDLGIVTHSKVTSDSAIVNLSEHKGLIYTSVTIEAAEGEDYTLGADLIGSTYQITSSQLNMGKYPESESIADNITFTYKDACSAGYQVTINDTDYGPYNFSNSKVHRVMLPKQPIKTFKYKVLDCNGTLLDVKLGVKNFNGNIE